MNNVRLLFALHAYICSTTCISRYAYTNQAPTQHATQAHTHTGTHTHTHTQSHLSRHLAAVGLVRLLAALLQPYMPSLTARIMQQMALPLSAADLSDELLAGGWLCCRSLGVGVGVGVGVGEGVILGEIGRAHV